MTQFCTYITFYRGNKLPPFYIGSSSIARIKNGYKGTVISKLYKDIWEQEIKDNPTLFEVRILTLHNTRKEAAQKELKFQMKLQVKDNPLYVNMGYFYGGHLVYSRTPEARKVISDARKGYKHSEETKTKISKSLKGQKRSAEFRAMLSDGRRKGSKCNSYGKPVSQETRDKLRNAQKGIPCPQRGRKGRPGWNKGEILSLETRIKMSESYWIITDSNGISERVDLLSDWCKERGFRYDSARPGFLTTGKFKGYLGIRIMKSDEI